MSVASSETSHDWAMAPSKRSLHVSRFERQIPRPRCERLVVSEDSPNDVHSPKDGFWWAHAGWLLDQKALWHMCPF